jgi:hypothetical protein
VRLPSGAVVVVVVLVVVVVVVVVGGGGGGGGWWWWCGDGFTPRFAGCCGASCVRRSIRENMKLTVKMVAGGAGMQTFLMDVEPSMTTAELKARCEAEHGITVGRVVFSGACVRAPTRVSRDRGRRQGAGRRKYDGRGGVLQRGRLRGSRARAGGQRCGGGGAGGTGRGWRGCGARQSCRSPRPGRRARRSRMRQRAMSLCCAAAAPRSCARCSRRTP